MGVEVALCISDKTDSEAIAGKKGQYVDYVGMNTLIKIALCV